MIVNQTVSSSDGRSKKYVYNDKNQIKEIQTQKGNIKLSYDKNGNMEEKILENGTTQSYTYNEFDKLETYTKGQYTYTYKYDGEQNRTQKIQTDHKDYHYDVWYDYNVDVDVVGKDRLKDSFKELRKQIENKEKNNDVCSYVEEDKYDVTYFKEDVITNYLLDRNQENTQILAVNDEVNVYGPTLLEENEATIIQGMNQSVVADIKSNKVEKYIYDDYGNSSKKEGHGYNSEYKDETGFLYLRARHYDPSIARFVSVDNNYQGESNAINTQNRYAYTLNNPYKYVDRDGNKAKKDTKKKVYPVEAETQYGSSYRKTTVRYSNGVTTNVIKKDNLDGTYTIATSDGKLERVKANQVDTAFNKALRRVSKPIIVCKEKKSPNIWDKGAKLYGDATKAWWDIFIEPRLGPVAKIGTFVYNHGGKEVLTFIDDCLDTMTKAGAVIAFVAGVVAVAATLALAIPALAGVTIVGASIGAIGYVAGSIALYTGVAAMGMSSAQMISGGTGYKLNGEKLTKAQAKKRIQEGQTNLAISSMGVSMGATALNKLPPKGASGAGASYDSFNAFKKANPVQTQGDHWHHIVEQSQQGKSGFSVQQINNTNNLIELTPSQHSQITGYYNTKSFQFTNGLSVRDWLAGQSFEMQYKFGIDKLKEFGVIK